MFRLLRKTLLLTFVFVLVLSSTICSNASTKTIRFPAEWEPQSAVWMAWERTEESQCGIQMIKVLTPQVQVKLLVFSSNDEAKARRILLQEGVDLNKITFVKMNFYDIWLRDSGPIFVIQDGLKKIVDFNFNGYGYPETYGGMAQLTETVDERIAEKFGYDMISTDIVSEGGDREFNGMGTMICNETVELQRNPGMTKEQIEAEFKRVLGVTKIIWIKGCLVEDQFPWTGTVPGPDGVSKAYTSWGTGGHVDEIARFVNATTIVMPEISAEEAVTHPVHAANKAILDECYQILSNTTDQDGNHFTIIKTPGCEPNYERISKTHSYYKTLQGFDFQDGSTVPDTDLDILAASSYMNFYISNNVVLVPKYWTEGKPDIIKQKDDQFAQIMKNVFPTKQIVQINPIELNTFNGGGGGGMHCIIQQEPQ